MNTELFLEGYPVDLYDNLSSYLNFAIADVKEFTSRETTFSKAITIPGTANNNRLFGNIFDTGSSNAHDSTADNIGYNFNASKSARCLMFQDNLQTFKGTLRLIQINVDGNGNEYEVALNGELTSLNVALSGAFLTDLDFSEYDETYSGTNIISSWDNQGSGLYYPLIDYGTYSTLKHDWDIKTFRPALFVKEYIDKMFEAAGFRYQSDLFETDRFKSLIIPHNRKILTTRDTEVLLAELSSTHVNQTAIAWDTIASSIFSLTTSNTHIEYTAVASVSGTLRVSIGGYFKNTNLFIEFKKNGVTVLSNTIIYDGTSNPQFFSWNDSISESFSTGDYITCQITRTGSDDHGITTCDVAFDSDIAQDVEVDYFDTVTINDTIPINVRQIDFFSSIIKLFNLYVYESRFDDRLIYISPYPDFYSTDSSNSVDWTYKLNRNAARKIKPMSELNAKIYNFRYKDDNDYYNELYKKRYNETYGSYSFDSEAEFVKQTNNLELVFAATPLVGYGGEEKVSPAIFKLNGTTEEQTDSVIRILQTKKVTGVTTWDILNGVTTLNSTTDYGYAGHFDNPDSPENDINFGVPKELFFELSGGDLSKTQFNIYYSGYMAEITNKDSKMMTAKFHLTPKDINELDFSKYVYVDGVLWRLNKITDYNASTPDICEVQLLKVNFTLY